MHRAVILFLLSVSSITAATWPAASAARTDVAAAVALASSGDTVTVPSGMANYTSPVNIPDGIKIIAAGIGSTILTNDGGGGILTLNDSTWAEGITAIGNGGDSDSSHFNISGTNIVIKLCKFDNSANWNGSAILAIQDQQQSVIPNGVMSQCQMVDSRIVILSPYINGMHDRWAQPTALGAQDTWYMENCSFTNINWDQNVIDANYGGGYVARFCTFHDCTPSMHAIQTGDTRAARKVEIYGCTNTGGAQPNTMSLTTTGVFYSNTCVAGFPAAKAIVLLSSARMYEAVATGGKADGHSNWDGNTPLFSGTHTGGNNAATLTDSTKTWTVNEFVISGWSRWIYNTTDGSKGQCTANTATTFTATLSGGTDNDWDTGDAYFITDGWPARDQPGRGKDASAWTGYYTNAAPVQASEPIYIWGNTGFAMPIVNLNDQGQPQSAQLMQEGRDYILSAHTNYTALAYPHPLLSQAGGGVPGTRPGGLVIKRATIAGGGL